MWRSLRQEERIVNTPTLICGNDNYKMFGVTRGKGRNDELQACLIHFSFFCAQSAIHGETLLFLYKDIHPLNWMSNNYRDVLRQFSWQLFKLWLRELF